MTQMTAARYKELLEELSQLELAIAKGEDTPQIDARITEITEILNNSGLMLDMDTGEVHPVEPFKGSFKPVKGRYIVQAYFNDRLPPWNGVRSAPESGDMDTLEKAEITFNLFNTTACKWMNNKIGKLRIVDTLGLSKTQIKFKSYPDAAVVKTN